MNIYHRYTNELYKLDLKSLLWTKMSPEGTRPLKSDKMTSWVDGQRMYLFGGYGKPSLSKFFESFCIDNFFYIRCIICTENLESGTPPHCNLFLNQVFQRQLVGVVGTTSLSSMRRKATRGTGQGIEYLVDALKLTIFVSANYS